MHAAYGNYAPANVFANNDNVEELAGTEIPIYDAAYEADPGAKRHAACDECRKRKLKCSGQPTGCTRCVKQSLTCHYSKQAVMGRPRKKRKTSEEVESIEAPQQQTVMEQFNHPIVSDFARTSTQAEFESLCPGPVSQYIKSRTPAPPPPFMTQGLLYENTASFIATSSDGTPPTESPPTPVLSQRVATEGAYPKDVANWPDFSTMTMLPQIVQDNHPDPSSSAEHFHSVDPMDSIRNLPNTPACACLPNLYLTLSSLSTLASFPISVHTIESLQTAHRTAQSVLYCPICPTKFQSGIQNVMLSGMLLTVIADNWHRVRTATAQELRGGFGPSRANSTVAGFPLTDIESLEWRVFAYQLLRANVFGEDFTPCPPCDQEETKFELDQAYPAEQSVRKCNRLVSIDTPTSTPTLQGLIEAMDRRQLAWHGKIPDTGEFPKHMSKVAMQDYMRGMSLKQVKEAEMDENGHLCLKIVESARLVLQTLNTPEPTL